MMENNEQMSSIDIEYFAKLKQRDEARKASLKKAQRKYLLKMREQNNSNNLVRFTCWIPAGMREDFKESINSLVSKYQSQKGE